MCPQSLVKNQYSSKSDVWSIGSLYFEMIFGRTPWSAESEKQLGQIIEKVPVRFPNEIAISEMSKDFIRKCLTVDEN